MATDAAGGAPVLLIAPLIGLLLLRLAQEHRRHLRAAEAAGPTAPPRLTVSASGPRPPRGAPPVNLPPVVPVELEVGASRVLRHPDRTAKPEDELRALLAAGPPDRCAGCGRPRTLLLSWWQACERDRYYHGVVRACVWCDAGTDQHLEAVWDGEHWLLRWGHPLPTAGDPALGLVVRQHLEAIATERPQLPAPRPDDVARVWTDGSGTRRCTDDAVALVRLLNPWLDLAAARRFLVHVADGDPRRPAPPVVGELRDVCSAAREAQDEVALLRAEVAAMPKETPPAANGSIWSTRWKHDAELRLHLEVAFHGPNQQGQFRWRMTLDDVVHEDPATPPGLARLFRQLVPEHGLASPLRRDLVRRVLSDYDQPSESSGWVSRDPRELWSERDWSLTLARIRRARVELAALAYPPEVRRALLEWIDRSHGLPLEAQVWRVPPDDPRAVDARTPADVHTRAAQLPSVSP